MATQLKNLDQESPSVRDQIKAFTSLLDGSIVQYPIKEATSGDPLPVPDWILVRKIDMVPRANGGPFVFVGPDERRPYSLGELDNLLDELRQERYAPRPSVEEFYRPLDVNLTGTTLFIFYLSNNWNWRFTRKARAVTLGEFEHMEEQENYYQLRHIMADSIGSQLPPPNGDCRIAYFIARQASDDFEHPFNLNVEMFYPGGGSKPNILPIVIDPDIRHPGGSGA